MKRFLIVVLTMFVFSLAIAVSGISLASLSSGEAYKGRTDLGFLFEENQTRDFKLYKKGDMVVGECVTISAKLSDLNKICEKLGVSVIQRYEVENRLVIEGISPLLNYFIEGRESNVQLSYENNQLVIGTPIIYGSY